jgi:small subunit ribosomal protein S21
VIYVMVRGDDIEQGIRALKKKCQREGIFREMRRREYYEKPSEKRKRKHGEAITRYRRQRRKIAARDVAANPNLIRKPRKDDRR